MRQADKAKKSCDKQIKQEKGWWMTLQKLGVLQIVAEFCASCSHILLVVMCISQFQFFSYASLTFSQSFAFTIQHP